MLNCRAPSIGERKALLPKSRIKASADRAGRSQPSEQLKDSTSAKLELWFRFLNKIWSIVQAGMAIWDAREELQSVPWSTLKKTAASIPKNATHMMAEWENADLSPKILELLSADLFKSHKGMKNSYNKLLLLWGRFLSQSTRHNILSNSTRRASTSNRPAAVLSWAMLCSRLATVWTRRASSTI